MYNFARYQSYFESLNNKNERPYRRPLKRHHLKKALKITRHESYATGQTRVPGLEDYIMFSSATQTPLQRKLSYSPDTEETLRLATQKLKQPAVQQQQQQQSANSAIPHAYVIPVPIVPSENLQSIAQQQQQTSSSSSVGNAADMSEFAAVIGSSNGMQTTTQGQMIGQTQYQFVTTAMPDAVAQVCCCFFFLQK